MVHLVTSPQRDHPRRFVILLVAGFFSLLARSSDSWPGIHKYAVISWVDGHFVVGVAALGGGARAQEYSHRLVVDVKIYYMGQSIQVRPSSKHPICVFCWAELDPAQLVPPPKRQQVDTLGVPPNCVCDVCACWFSHVRRCVTRRTSHPS